MKKVLIIMPSRNEEKRIAKTLEAYAKYFTELKKNRQLDWELLVVLNATTDNSAEVIDKIRKNNSEI